MFPQVNFVETLTCSTLINQSITIVAVWTSPTFLPGSEFHGDDVGARVGFAHGQRAHVFPCQQLAAECTVSSARARHPPQSVNVAAPWSRLATDLRHVLLLLLFVGVPHQLVDAQVGVGAVAEGDGGRHARHFLHHDAVFEVAHARPTVLHWEWGREYRMVAQTTRVWQLRHASCLMKLNRLQLRMKMNNFCNIFWPYLQAFHTHLCNRAVLIL